MGACQLYRPTSATVVSPGFKVGAHSLFSGIFERHEPPHLEDLNSANPVWQVVIIETPYTIIGFRNEKLEPGRILAARCVLEVKGGPILTTDCGKATTATKPFTGQTFERKDNTRKETE